jgi:basic membrane lipoprotein Med (substrate-binding protein (PBP1-ABC) superfamily)
LNTETRKAASTAVIAGIVIVIIALAAVGTVIALPSITGSKTVTVTTGVSTSSTSSPYKLALLVGGDTTDDGLNDQGVQIANWIASTYGWQVSISQDVPYSSQGSIMTTYAQEGYNVVWTDGNQFIGTTEAIAAQFPHTDFIMTPTYFGDNISSNVVALGADNQASGYYLAGVLSALMTNVTGAKSGAVGMMIGEWDAEQCYEFYAYQAGVHSINSSVPVFLTNTDNWGDATLGATDATAMINTNHIDILVPIADTTGVGAIAEATITGTAVIGTVLDQVDLSSTSMMTSVLLNMTAFIQPVIQHIINGTWSAIGGKVEEMQLGSLAPFHSYASLIPASVQSLLAADYQAIEHGTVLYSGIYPYGINATNGMFIPITYEANAPTSNPPPTPSG